MPFPTSPSWGYRVTQGLHVTAGYACVPLLLVKLWSVFPRLFARPPARPVADWLLHAAERVSIGVLVAAAIFQLATGIANAAQWYPWTTFSFRATHYAIAWVAIGALVVHIAVKLPVIRDALGADVDDTAHDRAAATQPGVLTRRGLLRTTWLAAGVAVLVTAGVVGAGAAPGLRLRHPLRRRARRHPDQQVRPGGRGHRHGDGARRTASSWGTPAARSAWPERTSRPSRRRTATLPIACVEGWSASGTWTGPTIRDVLRLVDAPSGRDVRVESLQPAGSYRVTTLPAGFADDDRTLLALSLGGAPLALDHGYPCRVIAPDRPGVLQTKWVARLDAL